MENPHAERQAVLLQRIVKNADKCTEVILEMNHCIEELLRANAYVKTASDLASRYRKNVAYNFNATQRASHAASASDDYGEREGEGGGTSAADI